MRGGHVVPECGWFYGDEWAKVIVGKGEKHERKWRENGLTGCCKAWIEDWGLGCARGSDVRGAGMCTGLGCAWGWDVRGTYREAFADRVEVSLLRQYRVTA